MAIIIPAPMAVSASHTRDIANLTRMLRSGTSEEQLEAAQTFASLAADGHGAGPGALSAAGARTEIARAGGIHALVQLAFGDKSSEHKAAAAAALANMVANHAENQEVIAGAGGIPALIDLVCDRADGAEAPQRANAAAALGNLAIDHQGNQTAVEDEGGIAALIGLLREAWGADDGEAGQSDEQDWQEAAAVAALRAATSGLPANFDAMRGLLSSKELAIVMNEESGGGKSSEAAAAVKRPKPS
jgi:hypothetical protein